MRVSVKRLDLIALLEQVKLGVNPKSLLPICRTVLLQTDKGLLRATSTNLEESLEGFCMAKIAQHGGTCVDPRSLAEILKRTAGEEASLVIPKGKTGILKVEAGSTTATLETMEKEDFPPIPEVKGKATRLYELVAGLKEISYAMATDNCRPVLAAVCFTPGKGKVELAAADGFRLSTTTIKSHGTIPTKLIIPHKAIELLMRLKFDEADMRVLEKRVGEREDGEINHHVSFHSGGLTLTVMAIRGNYPAYQQLIPKGGRAVEVDVEELKKALSIVATREAKSIRLVMNGHGYLIVSSKEDGNSIEAKVAAKGRIKIAFTPHYLKNLLAHLEGNMRMMCKSPSEPALIRQGKTLHLLMPMHVQW